jgi:hypothetical protein
MGAAVTPGTPQNLQLLGGIADEMANLLRVSAGNFVVSLTNTNGYYGISITLFPFDAAVEDGNGSPLCNFSGQVTLNITIKGVARTQNATIAPNNFSTAEVSGISNNTDSVTITVHIGTFRSSVADWALTVQRTLQYLPPKVLGPVVVILVLAIAVMYLSAMLLCPKVKFLPFFGLLLSIISVFTKIQFLIYLESIMLIPQDYNYTQCGGLEFISNDHSSAFLAMLITGCMAVGALFLSNWFFALRIMYFKSTASRDRVGCCHRCVVKCKVWAWVFCGVGQSAPKSVSKTKVTDEFQDDLNSIRSWEDTQHCGARTIVGVVTFFAGLDITHLFILESRLCNLKSMSAPFHESITKRIKALDKLSLVVVEIPFICLEVLCFHFVCIYIFIFNRCLFIYTDV